MSDFQERSPGIFLVGYLVEDIHVLVHLPAANYRPSSPNEGVHTPVVATVSLHYQTI